MDAFVDSMTAAVRVEGVVLKVDDAAGYAILNMVGLGRALMTPIYNTDVVTVGTWLSASVVLNNNNHSVEDKRHCRYAIIGKVSSVDSLVPTGCKIDKTGQELVKVSTEAIIGTVNDEVAIALSPKVGRIFVGAAARGDLTLEPGVWVLLNATSVEPAKTNKYCTWEAKSVEMVDDCKRLNMTVRQCQGRFVRFSDKNLCLLDLSGEGEGFVFVRSSDFVDKVSQRELKAAKAIKVYANQPVSRSALYPVQVCYASVMSDDEVPQVETEIEEIDEKHIENNNQDEASGGAQETSNGELTKKEESDEENVHNCHFTEALRYLMKSSKISEHLMKVNPEVHNRIAKVLQKAQEEKNGFN